MIESDASVEHQEFVEACANRDVLEAVKIHERHRLNSFAFLSTIAGRDNAERSGT
jgi:DNA-binding GntR family transcriptional regulator